MQDGLAKTMTYGDGEGQNTKHFYAGGKKPMKKKKKCNKKIKITKKIDK